MILFWACPIGPIKVAICFSLFFFSFGGHFGYLATPKNPMPKYSGILLKK
jgi:hypothetical protein